jgi:RNA polymerase sigma factor (sigma-70 family)
VALVTSDAGQGDHPGEPSDRALVEAHRRGDPEAFTQIVRAHYRMLLAQAERRLGNHAEAEDVVQEVFERAFKAIDRFGGEFRLAAWLSAITSHVCADHGSRGSAQRRMVERAGGQAVPADDLTDSVRDPRVTAAVQAAMNALPTSQRSTFVLHAVDGYSYPEVADQLGISEANARARVHRAKVTLRRRLAGLRETLAGVIGIPAGMRLFGRSARGSGPRSVPGGVVGRVAHATPAQHLAVAPIASELLPSGVVQHGPAYGAAQSCITAEPATGQGLFNLPQMAGQLASRVVATPLGQVLVASAPSAPKGSLMAGLAVGIAVASAPFAAPFVTPTAQPRPPSVASSTQLVSASSVFTAPVAHRLSSPAPAPTQTPGSATTSAAGGAPAETEATTAAAAPTNVPTTTPATDTTASSGGSTGASTSKPAWEVLAQRAPITAATVPAGPSTSQATPGTTPSGGSGGTTATTSVAGAGGGTVVAGAACPWLSSFSGGGPGQALASDALHGDPVSTLQTHKLGLTSVGSDPVVASSGSIDGLGTAGGSVPVTVLAGACLPPLQGALVADVTGPGGAEVQLQGSLVMVIGDQSDAGYLFRGKVVALSSGDGGVPTTGGAGGAGSATANTLPWGIPDRFIAQLEITEPANVAQLQIAFLVATPPSGTPSTGAPTGASTTPISESGSSGSVGTAGSDGASGTTGTTGTTGSSGTVSSSSAGTSTGTSDPATPAPSDPTAPAGDPTTSVVSEPDVPTDGTASPAADPGSGAGAGATAGSTSLTTETTASTGSSGMTGSTDSTAPVSGTTPTATGQAAG